MKIYRHHNLTHNVRAVVFYETDGDHSAWVVIGLERDVGSQGASAVQAIERFDAALNFDVQGCIALGIVREPSPAKYHQMWDRAERL